MPVLPNQRHEAFAHAHAKGKTADEPYALAGYRDGIGIRVRMPEDPGAAGKSDAATKVKLLAGYDVKTERPTGAKTVRAKGASAQAEAGNMKLVRGSWNTAFLDELCSFPNAQFDDQVDAFADALNELALGSTFTLANV